MREMTQNQRRILELLKLGWTLSYYAYTNRWTLYKNNPADAEFIPAASAQAVCQQPGVIRTRFDIGVRFTWHAVNNQPTTSNERIS